MEQRKELLAREVERAVQLREFALVFHMGDRATCMSIETTQRIEKLEMQRRKGRHCRSVRALRREGSRIRQKEKLKPHRNQAASKGELCMACCCSVAQSCPTL